MWNRDKYKNSEEIWYLEKHISEGDRWPGEQIINSLRTCGLFLLRGGTVFTKDKTLQLAEQFGIPLNQSPEECYIFEVKDEGYDPNHPKFRGPSSNRQLTFHTDRCDIILFHCVRKASEGGVNMLVNTEALYEVLKREDPEALKVLEGPFAYKRHNADPAHPFTTYELPVFDFKEKIMSTTLMTYLISKADSDPDLPGLTGQQRHALDKLQEICHRPENHLQVKLEPGDFLFLNNINMLHSRTAFSDSAEPRLYYRVWLSVPWSQPLPDSFANLFGSTEAGSVRGGFKKF